MDLMQRCFMVRMNVADKLAKLAREQSKAVAKNNSNNSNNKTVGEEK